MDDEFGVDDDFLAALAASDAGTSRNPAVRLQQPPPQRIQQPTPQRLDRAIPPPAANASAAKPVQPTPQVLPARSSGSSILVSPRQKGNPVLTCLKSVAWEYSDIPADYGLGLTTCALFLRYCLYIYIVILGYWFADGWDNGNNSLKYHRLHPEYIYTRLRGLQGKYNLRILLTMVDIPNHEESLRELAKVSLVNSATVILCWSATEAARYLELYKSYEHASFAAIRGQQAQGYAERLVEFVTVPRAINKADAVALVSSFGSLRHAINADVEQIGVVGGWGEKKVKAWTRAVEEPFRVRKARKRAAVTSKLRGGHDVESTEAVREAAAAEGRPTPSTSSASAAGEDLSEGVAAALARLREKG